MCFVDLEPCEVWAERDRRARKPRRCSCCKVEIRAGDVYVSHFSVFEGDATYQSMCKACEADRREFASAHDGTLCTPGALKMTVAECIGEGDDDARWEAMLVRIKTRSSGVR